MTPGPATDILTTLKERGFVQDCTDEAGLRELAAKGPVTVYCGFDPTADSLHIGSMVPIMGLLHFQLAGHRPIALVGGATGMVGDPSGKSAERNLQTEAVINHNVDGVRRTLERFLSTEGDNAAIVVNNADWNRDMSFIEFLREVGKFFRVGEMLGKESVRARLHSDTGLSFTEFSYMLLQAYDFKYLREAYDCVLQIGGADQWGNITAGTELIRKSGGKQGAYGLTFPLLTTATGEKMGKTANGAVWLDPAKTTVYDFYQYWVRADDRDVERFLKLFTLLPLHDIAAIVVQHEQNPSARLGQRRLAEEITRLVHGPAEAEKAIAASQALFGGQLTRMTDQQLRAVFPDVPSLQLPASSLADGVPLTDVLTQGKLADSNKDAKRLLKEGGLYLNNQPVPPDKRTLTREDLLGETMLILRAGKKRYCLVQFV